MQLVYNLPHAQRSYVRVDIDVPTTAMKRAKPSGQSSLDCWLKKTKVAKQTNFTFIL